MVDLSSFNEDRPGRPYEAWLRTRLLQEGLVGLGTGTSPFTGEAQLTAGGYFGYQRDAAFGAPDAATDWRWMFRASAPDQFVLGSNGGTGSTELSAPDPLRLDGGDEEIVAGWTVKFEGGAAASLVDGTGHVQVGADGAANLGLDGDEVQARSAGLVSPLNLNPSGGDVVLFDGSGGSDVLEVAGDQAVLNFSGLVGPQGLHFADGEGRLYYRSTPNTLGIEDASGVVIMAWDVDDGYIYGPGGVLWMWPAPADSTLVLDNVNEVRLEDGSVSDPSLTFGSAQTTGLFLDVSGNLAGTRAGVEVFRTSQNDWVFEVAQVHVQAGSTAAPGLVFEAEDDTGLKWGGAGKLEMVVSGVRSLYQDTGQIVGIDSPAPKNLGNSGNRWNTIFAVNGTINTSDPRMKRDMRMLDKGRTLDFLRRLTPQRGKWKDGRRDHMWLDAEDVGQALAEVGDDFGGFIDPSRMSEAEIEATLPTMYDPDDFVGDPAGEAAARAEARERILSGPKGLRYTEFVAPLIAAVQHLADEVDDLKKNSDKGRGR